MEVLWNQQWMQMKKKVSGNSADGILLGVTDMTVEIEAEAKCHTVV